MTEIDAWLSVCCRERQNQAKINRRLDKKSKEYQLLIEDERRNAEQYKDQVSDSVLPALLHVYSYSSFSFSYLACATRSA